MSLRRIEALQWFGLFGGALAWTAQFVFGFGLVIAHCGAGARWGIGVHTWEVAAAVAAAIVVMGAEAAAIVAWLATKDVEHDAAPPQGRVHFFALASTAANVLFLCIVLLGGFGTLALEPCRPA